MSRPRTSVAGETPSASTVTHSSVSAGSSRRSATRTWRMRLMRGRLQEEHGVAVAVEAVALLHRCLIGPPDQINAAQRAHEQEQARPWQVEVGQERIDGP